ncbi:MAG: hypothetical protein KCHDKBKB_00765 [Elusimicrobia bacterium]|nr:hypothetical protein [Elusimicrobiota bacterium]
MNKEKKPIKVLAWCDSPAVSTGFATVSRGILKHLANTGDYLIDIIGINDRGGYKDPYEHPYRIYPAKAGIDVNGDYHGRPTLISALLGKDKELLPPWDIVFLLNDPFILEEPIQVFNTGTLPVIKKTQETWKEKIDPGFWFKTIYYIPVDSPIKGNWVDASIAHCDYPVSYSNYGKAEIEKADQGLGNPTKVGDRMKTIYHGVDLTQFKPITPEERKAFRDKFFEGKVHDETFVVTSVARNQLRKDIPRTMKIFREFQKRRPDSFLYIHAAEKDAWGSLREYATMFGLELGKDWAVPAGFSAHYGFPTTFMNDLYNSSDAILSTTLGEGVGYYNLESFATKTLVVAPDNTVHPELFNYDPKKVDVGNIQNLPDTETLRGLPYKSGSTSSEWATYGPQDFERVRPLGNVDDAVKKLVWAFDNPDKVKKITQNAYDWIQDYTWEKIGDQWDKLFKEVYDELEKERSKARVASNLKPRSTPAKS